MSKTLNYRISALAEDDLIAIFLQSIDVWGMDQALQYSRMIEDAFMHLANYPGSGKNREYLYPGACSFPVGSHVIFYRQQDSHIEIARVLHQRMDYQQHLNP